MRRNRQVSAICLPENTVAVISQERIVFGIDASKQEIDNLIEEELLLQKNDTDTVECFDKARSTVLSFIPTFDCNLRCRYCYARGGESNKTIDIELAKSIIKNSAKETKIDYLDLYLVGGGEPLLNTGVAKQIVAEARDNFKSVIMHTVTNGTFGQEIRDWLPIIDCRIRVSYDSIGHDKNRPYKSGKQSSLNVRENIKWLVNHKIPTIVQCIITKENADNIEQTIADIANLGITVVKIEPVLATGVSRADKEMMLNPYTFAAILMRAISFVSDNDINLKIDTGYFSEPSDEHYCGMTNGNKIVTPDGLITSCVEVAKHSDPYSKNIIYGHIEEGRMVMDAEKTNKLKSFVSVEQCQECQFLMICKSGCPMANIWQGGLPIQKSSFTCAVEKTFLPKLLLAISKNPTIGDIVLDRAEIKNC